VGINPGEAPQSPSREFLSRLDRDKVVRRLSECEPRPKGAVEATTSRPAVIVTVGPIEWRADDEAWVKLIGGDTPMPMRGGGKALVNAYFRSAQALGVQVRYNAPVDAIELDGGVPDDRVARDALGLAGDERAVVNLGNLRPAKAHENRSTLGERL